MDITTILLILGGIFVVTFLISYSNNKNSEQVKSFYKVYSEKGLALVKKLEEMLENNETYYTFTAIKLYNTMFNEDLKDLDEFENAIGIGGYIDEPEDSQKSIAADYINGITGDLAQRHLAEFVELKAINEQDAMNEFGLNINSDEFIHDNINNVDWLEERTISTTYNYGGFSYRLGSKSGFSYKTGSLKVVANKNQQFIPIDRGTLFITNKRIIFVGKQNKVNKTIALDDILEFSIFKDGILIGKSNGKKPLIEIPEWIIQPKKAPLKRDHVNRIVRVLERVISKTQFKNISA